MVCRESRLSSAIVTFARDMSGLEDNQVLGLNHALMQEGAHAPAVTSEQWNGLIDQVRADYEAGRLRTIPGSRNPLTRLEAARNETPDPQRFYAARNLVSRATRARDAQVAYFTGYARELGVPANHAATEFWVHFQDATDNARMCASPAFSSAWSSNPDNTDLMVDRRSLYAYEQMEITRAARLGESEAQPAVARFPVDSTAIAEMGYDANSGRVEVVMRSNPDRVYAYRMSQTEWMEFSQSESVGAYFARHVRGNPDYSYAGSDEAGRASVDRRCATCGQFAGPSHHCPITGSEEDLNRDVRLAVERARARAAGVAEPSQLPQPARMQPVRTVRYTAEYDGQAISMRIPGVTRITQEARRANSVQVPVRASFPGAEGGTVTGLVQVNYNGRGQGYAVEAITTPGDSGTDNLRCTCARYRATYHCEHIDATVSRSRSVINGTERATPEQAQIAAAAVTQDLTGAFDSSVAATDAAAVGWQPLATSFAGDPAAFQQVYTEFRAKRQEYLDAVANGADPATLEYPVPYMRENAFNGLAQRGSGRGFGIELEYDFPNTMDYRERAEANQRIGQELYDAGLTTSARQQGYGASHGVVREHHARGWSFENDPSVSGGEIVAPVMYDEPDTWTNIEKVCEILQRNGAVATASSGMHVHVGTGDYDHRIENHNRLLQAFAENEDLVYRMSSNPDRGRHRGRGYCGPNSLPSTPYTTVGTAARDHMGHHLALNMQSVRGQDGDHVEFRTFDSSLKPGVIQAQIATAVYMAEGATRGGSTTPNENRDPIGSHVAANPGRSALTGDAWHESTKGMRKFLDRFVPGTGGDETQNPRVRQMVALFAMTRWQRNGRA